MRAGWVWFSVVIVVWALLGASPGWAVPAVVRGTSALKVRRGPGAQYPVFGRLQQGDRVEVEKVEGLWANIRTASGVTGYVRKDYLSFAAGLPGREATAAPPARQPEPGPQPAAGATAERLREMEARNAQLEAELNALREQSAKAAAPQPAPAGETQPVLTADSQSDLRRLIRLTEEIHTQVGAMRTSPSRTIEPADAADQHQVATTAWLLVIGVLFGLFVGNAYGRQQERRRRTRIRF